MPSKPKQPLSGRTIAVTRAADQAHELCTKLQEAGANVLELPLIQTITDAPADDLKDTFSDLWTYEWILFTSPNGVRHFFELFFKEFDDIRAIGNARFAAVGKATAAELTKFHLRTDVVPKTATSDALADALLKEQTLDNLSVLIITGNKSGPELAKRLESERAIVDSIQVYRTENTDLTQHAHAASFRKDGADAIIFASGSAVESFVAQAAALKTAPNALRPQTCSIGPSTSEAMKKLGIPVDMEAAETSMDAIVKTMAKHFSGK
jgi:uroporphyrinogen-III synthase